MKQKNIFIFIFLMLSISIISAASFEETYSVSSNIDATSIQVESLKYDPYPVNPDEYFTLWVTAIKTGSGSTQATFELIPEFPFSLDSNEQAQRTFSKLTGEGVLLEYKIRVDEDAVEGTNEIKLKYKLEGSTSWVTKTFNIQVEASQTEFDGVIQDYESGSLSLALANVGKNVANSVIVRIPEQEGYKASGVSGQMVGNLENGDYTIVSFEVEQIKRNFDIITFQIDYTDTIGKRRSLYLDQQVVGSSTINPMNATSRNFPAGATRPGTVQTTSSNSWKYALTIIAIGLIAYGFYKRNESKKKNSPKSKKIK